MLQRQEPEDFVIATGEQHSVREFVNADSLLTGPLEPRNQWHAVVKIAGPKMCQAYRRQHGFNAIAQLAQMVARVVGFAGRIRFDPPKPDRLPRKLLGTRLIALRWTSNQGVLKT